MLEIEKNGYFYIYVVKVYNSDAEPLTPEIEPYDEIGLVFSEDGTFTTAVNYLENIYGDELIEIKKLTSIGWGGPTLTFKDFNTENNIFPYKIINTKEIKNV